MTGRNDPCPCGSGRKYKMCCLRIAAASGDFTPAERQSAQDKLFEYGASPRLERHRKVCATMFWGSEERAAAVRARVSGEIWHGELFRYQMCMCMDADEDEGHTVLDGYLSERGHDLQPGERVYLERMQSAHLALYEIEEVRPGVGIHLRDVWQDRSCWVVERSGSRQLVRWDLLAARVFPAAGGELQIEGDTSLFNHDDKERILKRLETEYAKYEAHTRGTKDAFLKRCGSLFHTMWMEHEVFRPLPTMVTPEGAPIELGISRIDVGDVDILRASLSEHDAFEEEPDNVWTCTEEEGRVLATMRLAGHLLILEGLSRERLQRARKLLRAAAPNAGLKHRSTHYTDPVEALGREPPEPQDRGGKLPDEEANEWVTKFKTEHYRRWIDDKIPALENLTPREAARDETMRPRLVGLLKSIENAEARERAGGRPAITLDWIWKELLLDR